MSRDDFRDLMRTNVGRARGKKLLIASWCLVEDKPRVFSEFGDDYFKLKVCMEAEDYNKVAYKILSFIRYSEVSEAVVVTVDGSPHCIQLQHMLEEIARKFADVRVRHIVFAQGKLIEVPKEAVKASRFLSKVKKLWERNRQSP